jgi:hypothetical protein
MGDLVYLSQRRALRKAYKVRCRVVRERDFVLLGEEGLDLSPEGMLVRCESDVFCGDECVVSFKATELGIWFDTMAKVARVIEGRRPTDRCRAIGLSFDGLDAVHKLILRGHLRKVPPPLPARAQRVDYAATIRKIAYG